MKPQARRVILSLWFTVLVAALAWAAAYLVTWQMPLATRLAVGLTAAAVLTVVSVKALSAS